MGLRATNLQLVSTRTWKPPRRTRTLVRALVAVVTLVAVVVPLAAGFGESDEAAVVMGVGVAFALLALVGHLWALVDRRGRSVQNRLFGLAVLAARPGGP